MNSEANTQSVLGEDVTHLDQPMVDTTLIGRCATLKAQIEHLKNLKVLQDERETFEGRRTVVQSAVNVLQPLWIQRGVLTAHGIQVEVPNEAFLLRQQYAKLLRDFQNDPATLARSNALPPDTLRNGCVTKLRQNLRDAWDSYVAKHTIPVNESLLSVLERVPGFEKTVTAIRDAKNRVRSYSSSVPSSASDIEKFEQAIQDLSAKWGELEGENLPTSVLNFLRAAGQGGATLDLLLPEVRDWLSERELERSFHVVIN